jgi:hypothetical protein
VTAIVGVMGPLWASNAAGTTITSVVLAAAGRWATGFGEAAGLATAGLAAATFAAAGFAAAVVGRLLAAAFVDAGFVAAFVAVAFAVPDVLGRVAFDVLARPDFLGAAVLDRRFVAPDPVPVDPVDDSSAIASLLLGAAIVHQARPDRAGNAC